jgi:hypothetical protein
MYQKASISPLSRTQVSKILNGHSVRVSPGSHHDIELSKEQFKKFSKAHKNGKAMTLTMDPYQIQNHQHLRGSGVSRTKKFNKWVDTLGAKPVIDAGMTRATTAISGSGVSRTKKFDKWVDTLGARPVIDAGMTRASSAISGGKINRLKKANRWTDYAIGTVNNGIHLASNAAQAYKEATKPSMTDLLGFGLKKRKSNRRRKRSPSDERRGGALMPAGY